MSKASVASLLPRWGDMPRNLGKDKERKRILCTLEEKKDEREKEDTRKRDVTKISKHPVEMEDTRKICGLAIGGLR